jgi:lactoylglutathione lyase
LTKPALNLIVLRASDVDKTLKFYEAVGISFVQEQHVSGPIHYSCEMDSIIIEIYPGQPGTAPDRKNGGSTTLGFRVVALDSILAAVQHMGAKLLTNPKDSPWGRRAVVEDPDGRAIELNELAGD